MNPFKMFVVAMISIVLMAPALAQDKPQWRNGTEISCGQPFPCLTAEEMQTLTGKTLKYRHSRFQEFGYVYLSLKEDGKAEGKNNKSSAGGSWEMKDNVISFKTSPWNDFSFVFYRFGDQVFMTPRTAAGGGSLFPVAVVSEPG